MNCDEIKHLKALGPCILESKAVKIHRSYCSVTVWVFAALAASSSFAASPTLTFCDEFDDLSLWNGTTGTWDTSYSWQGSANGSTLPNEQEWYIDANYGPTSSVKPWTIANGVVTITATQADQSLQSLISDHKYISGQLNTWKGFGQAYGYFELRAKLPRGQGLWPAFWLEPKDGTGSHEIDVMEVLGQDTSTLYTTLHVHTPPPSSTIPGVETVSDMSAGFHQFGVDWEADKITWYFDRQSVFQTATPAALNVNKPMFMIVNLAVGGPMPGLVNSSTPFPSSMQVDYVRVYSSFPGGTALASATLSTDKCSKPNPPQNLSVKHP